MIADRETPRRAAGGGGEGSRHSGCGLCSSPVASSPLRKRGLTPIHYNKHLFDEDRLLSVCANTRAESISSHKDKRINTGKSFLKVRVSRYITRSDSAICFSFVFAPWRYTQIILDSRSIHNSLHRRAYARHILASTQLPRNSFYLDDLVWVPLPRSYASCSAGITHERFTCATAEHAKQSAATESSPPRRRRALANGVFRVQCDARTHAMHWQRPTFPYHSAS